MMVMRFVMWFYWRIWWWRHDRRVDSAIDVIEEAMSTSSPVYVHPESGGPPVFGIFHLTADGEAVELEEMGHDHLERSERRSR